MAESEVQLAELVGTLRSELERAIDDGAQSAVKFELGTIELDLEVGVTKSAGADGGIRFWVVTLGGNANREHAATQRIHLTLTPRGRAGEEISGPGRR